jgi:hypothetical protein
MIRVNSQQSFRRKERKKKRKGLQELESQAIIGEGLHVIYAIWESK